MAKTKQLKCVLRRHSQGTDEQPRNEAYDKLVPRKHEKKHYGRAEDGRR